jgi:outer membrane protein assembly factor BamB
VVTNHTTPARVSKRWEYTPPQAMIPTAPVAAAGMIFTGGADGVVRALDAQTGQPRWTAYTGGGYIKYPPSIWEGRAYVGGGDGYVYCLEAATGRLLWRFRAAPEERMIPIYGRLTSTWAVGSGVLVENGVAYAAAGISNFDGTHVYALDAVSGKIRWQNHTSGDTGEDLPEGGVSVQGHFLLHKDAIYMAGGNLITAPERPDAPVRTSVATYTATRNPRTVASYTLADGAFSAAGSGRGKDLFLRGGQVRAAGYPLYWRPEDDHFLSPMELETPAGVIAVATNSVGLLAAASDPAQKPTAVWTHKTFEEIAAVAVTKNALIVTGLDRDPKDYQKTTSGLAAVNLADGKLLWKAPLSAAPAAWGLALDKAGQIIVTLTDGRVLSYAGAGG